MFLWCFKCERCFPVDVPDGTVIEDAVIPDKCVYPGCPGTTEGFRGWDWVRGTVKAFYRVEYPERPELNQVYPWHPDESSGEPCRIS